MNGNALVKVAKSAGLLLVGVALTVTSGCGGGSPKLEGSKEFHFLPDNPVVIGSFRFDEITKSQAYKDFMAEADKMVGKDLPVKEGLEQELGLIPEDVARAIFAVGKSGEDFVAVVTTKKPVTASELTAKFKVQVLTFGAPPKTMNVKFKEVKVGSFTVHESDGHSFALCVADANTVVYGPMESLKKVLERNQAPELSDDMKKTLGLADQSKAAFLAVNVKGMGDAKKDLPKDAAEHADKVEAFAITAGFGSDAQLSLSAICKDAAAAEFLRKEATDGIKGFQDDLGKLPKEMQSIKEELTKVVDSVKVSASGNQLTGTAAAKPSTIVRALLGIHFLGQQAATTFEKVGKAIEEAK